MSSVVLSGDTSGAITLSAPSVAGTNTITLPASTGTVLTTGSPQSGGVIQVVNATYSTHTTTGSSTFSDTGLTATITPKFATSKILVLIDHAGCGKADNNTRLSLQLLRNASVLYKIEDSGGYTGNSTPNYFGGISSAYLDSPATTSATTYKTQFCSYSNVITASVQTNGATSTITLMEIAA